MSATPLEKIERTRMVLGALCDGMTGSEVGSRLGLRIAELHDELSAGIAELRAQQTNNSSDDSPYEYRFNAVAAGWVTLREQASVRHFLERGKSVERRLDLPWEPVAGLSDV
ncbi:hypothetical protein IV500_04200 [Paeniglutamicibacter antarcticus]|uniref:Uncharacterized protein n=1 Tax=Arthrobacter terrae TaxID=2935737 RepID=A0A931CHE3_9MICC|nr:hypothetical protein [Arthrobacter terrae]MBG0738622.1 hypothetical protein [Arthrobacter terrae]